MNLALPQAVAALGMLTTPGRKAVAQLALPTDLFMVTAHHGRCGQSLDLVVTLLRTRPQRFRSSMAGELAYALLTPAGLLALLRAPLEGAADDRLALARFCSPAELLTLHDTLLMATDGPSRLQHFARWIESRIRQRHGLSRQQQRVAEAAALIQRQPGTAQLADLRSQLHVSRRQLERDFRFWLGVSPAAYARLVRFQRAAAALAGGEGLSATAAAHAFTDQAHLSRAFRELSLLTPREFSRRAAAAHRPDAQMLAGRVVVVDAPASQAGPDAG
jgi:AraC-like DNA-binding protein